MPTANQRVINGWAMYDWANSAYNLVITSTVFPAYYNAITLTKAYGDKVSFFGKKFVNTALFNYALAAAYLVIALVSPILSSIADVKGNKKPFMQFFCYVGGGACCLLYFFRLETLELGIICFALAAIGYCGSLVFYNSYLPEIAAEKDQDSVSARGFAYGYIGSILLQLICFVFILKPGWFGITDPAFGPRLSFFLVGLWWIGFAQLTFRALPPPITSSKSNGASIFTKGFRELKKVWNELKTFPVLKSFLTAFFLYSMGVQTVMLAAANFGEKELHLSTTQLIATILTIQLVAIPGAWLMAHLSSVFGNIRVLAGVVMIWIAICIVAYFIQTALHFYLLAAMVGLVMGGIQSLSRSTYSKYLPITKDTASYFSFYDVSEKVAIVIGMFGFGYIEEKTGNMRNSIILLVIFFALGLFFLITTFYQLKRHSQPYLST